MRETDIRVRWQRVVSNDGKPLRELVLCGADKTIIAADAKIVGDTVVVFSSQISEAVAVRCAWKNDPMVNLFGRNGLPVGPIRTDSFHLVNTDSEEW